tara:strand:- start:1852 stop:3357 length:1506 start_codon:yes stop_codon:yes gene_type:complete
MQIIIPVGISIIESFNRSKDVDAASKIELSKFRGKPHDDLIVKTVYDHFNKFLSAYLGHNGNSAEIESLKVLESHEYESFGAISLVHLLPTDTAESYLSSLFIKDYLEKKGYQVSVRIINELSYLNTDTFTSRGLKNLIDITCSIVQKIRQNKDIPIIIGTTGFKAETSILLLLAQLLGINVFYKHEYMENTAILFPHLPINIDAKKWARWKPLVKSVMAAERNTELMVLPISEFEDSVANESISDIEFLFKIDRELGGVSLSVFGYMLAEASEIDVDGILLPESNIAIDERLKLNESEMPHSPKGSREFMKKISELDFVCVIRNIKFENTAESRVKSKYNSLAPNEIELVYSDGTKGLVVKVQTTAKDFAGHKEAKRRISESSNIYFKDNSLMKNERKFLFNPGELLRSQFETELVSIGELEREAEKIIAERDKVIAPFIEKIEKLKKSSKATRKNFEKEMEKIKNELALLKEKYDEHLLECETVDEKDRIDSRVKLFKS